MSTMNERKEPSGFEKCCLCILLLMIIVIVMFNTMIVKVNDISSDNVVMHGEASYLDKGFTKVEYSPISKSDTRLIYDLDTGVEVDEFNNVSESKLEVYIFGGGQTYEVTSYTDWEWNEYIIPYLYDRLVEYRDLHDNGLYARKYANRIDIILAIISKRDGERDEFVKVARGLLDVDDPVIRASAGLMLLRKGDKVDRINCEKLMYDENEWVRRQVAKYF